MADLTILKLDLLEGQTFTNIEITKPLEVEVTIKGEGPILAYLKNKPQKGPLVQQKMVTAAEKFLAKVKLTLLAELKKFDAKLPTMSPAQQKDTINTLTVLSKQIVIATKAGAEAAVDAEWNEFVTDKKLLSKYRKVTALKVTAATIGMAASLAKAIASLGTAATAYVGIFTSVVQIATEIKNGLAGEKQIREQLLQMVEQTDQGIQGGLTRAGAVGQGMREVSRGILGPIMDEFANSITGIDSKCKLHRVKIAKVEEDCRNMTAQVMKGLEKVSDMEKVAISPEQKKKVKLLADTNEELLNKIETLQKDLPTVRTFNKTVRDMADAWMKGELPRTTGVTSSAELDMLKVAVGIGLTIKTIVETVQVLR